MALSLHIHYALIAIGCIFILGFGVFSFVVLKFKKGDNPVASAIGASIGLVSALVITCISAYTVLFKDKITEKQNAKDIVIEEWALGVMIMFGIVGSSIFYLGLNLDNLSFFASA